MQTHIDFKATIELTTKIWPKSLPLVDTEKALFPVQSNLRADGIRDITYV